MPDNVLIIRLHSLSGEDISMVTGDFDGERQAVEAIASALDERRSLVLTQAGYDHETETNGVVVNLANVVLVRVSTSDSAGAGQYL
ncbi:MULTISPECIES: hypothetical protein [Nonomuraea]|uniref:Uncharacterized protein n=1 Tax=Nonomuraea mangrovi TaxID=2316207 RepID=A0ABW4SKD0_9ACTN